MLTGVTPSKTAEGPWGATGGGFKSRRPDPLNRKPGFEATQRSKNRHKLTLGNGKYVLGSRMRAGDEVT